MSGDLRTGGGWYFAGEAFPSFAAADEGEEGGVPNRRPAGGVQASRGAEDVESPSSSSAPLSDDVATIARLPDGRWAVRNDRDISDLTLDDVADLIVCFREWVALLWARRGGKP